jgi:hypothetical protein
MRDEVEEFLKRVAQMRAQAEAQARAQQQRLAPAAQQPSQQPPQRRQQLPRERPQPARAQQSSPPRLVPETVRYAPAEVVDAELAEVGDNVARHVAEHLRGPQEIAEHTRHLGEEVDAADEKLEAHLHQVFDHELGRLKKSASVTAATPHAAPAPDTTISEMLQMLSSPASIRDAFVMSEILRRPEERW